MVLLDYAVLPGGRVVRAVDPQGTLLMAVTTFIGGESEWQPIARVELYPAQNILRSVPATFAFPPGDPRLRAVNRARLDPAHRYVPLLRVRDGQGRDYGDAAAYIELRAGPAKGGKLLYVWCTLLAGPQGAAILADVVTWILKATLPPPRLGALHFQDPSHAVLNFNALSWLDYGVQYCDAVPAARWSLFTQLPIAPTNRAVWLTNAVGAAPSRFYRLVVR